LNKSSASLKLPRLHEVEAELLGRSLSRYIPSAWPVLEPSTEFLPGWHIDAIAEHLQDVTEGHITRLIVNIPPRYMKSLGTSVFWPTWSWTRKPELRWVFASYSQSLSTKHSVDRRTLIQSSWYQERWGDRFSLASDQNVKTEFLNDRRGHMIATSFGGTATGKGGDIIVVDDPLNPEEAHSDIEREKANRIFDQTLSTRLDDKKTGAIVLIMQRLHDEDLTGHLIEKGGFVHLCLPAEYEPQHPFFWPDDPREEPGDLLWPLREGAAEIAKAKIDLGSYGYAGQYQQRPAPAEGGIFKRAWWRYFDPDHLDYGQWQLEPLFGLVTSWDTALKDKTTNDYCVGTVWGATGANRFLLRRVRERMNLPDTKRAVSELAAWVESHFPHLPHSIIVENAANGPDVVAQLRNEISGLILNRPEGDKVQRAHAVSGILEAGNVLVPGAALNDGSGFDTARTPAWVQELIEECAAFPNAANDDQVDSVTQALLRMKGKYGRKPKGVERPHERQISAGMADRKF
jgi:predicted phage terminase large subunit-like protein